MYVADRFREIGLDPIGDDGTFFQHFTMPVVDLTEMSTLTGPGGKTYQPRVDFTESVGGRSGSGKAEAEIAAVGGAARSAGLNDFAGASVRGKIALVTGPAAPAGGSSVENSYQEGAIGVLLVGGATLRYSYIPRLQSETIPTFVISEDVANQLLAPTGRTLTTAQALVRAHRSDSSAPASGFDAIAGSSAARWHVSNASSKVCGEITRIPPDVARAGPESGFDRLGTRRCTTTPS